jgi:hypothetical protein
MIPRRLWFALIALAILIALIPALTPSISAQNDKSSSSETSDGLRIVTLSTPRGNVKVYLPEVIVAGDTISGTVTTEPKGKDEKEKKENADRLDTYRIKIIDETMKLAEGWRKAVRVPEDAKTAELTLSDEKGKQLAQAFIALARLAELLAREGNPSFPPVGQSGLPYPISGSFDGDSANTTVKIRDANGKVIAESPRNVFVEVPKTVVGPNNIVVNDNGNTSTGSFRALKIDLTAPKTSLLKGESTELHVEVQGLQGISQSIPIQIQNQTPQNINLTGGNTQNVNIQPSQVTTGGTFNWSTNVTGIGTGGFNITGTIPTTAGPQPTLTITSQNPSTPTQTSGAQTVASPIPKPPDQVAVTMTAAEMKKRCDELRRQLNEAKGPCKKKEQDCSELEKKLEAARAAADKAQADYDKKKAEFDAAMQNALNNLITAARAKGFDTKLSLKPENKNYQPLKLAEGVVIYFDASGLTDLQNADSYIGNLSNALRQMVNSATINQLKQLAAALAIAAKNNQAAMDARKAAYDALVKCAAERDALCPKVKELEAELDKCEKEAAAQADAERIAKAKEEADRKAAAEAKRLADEAEAKRKADETKATAEANRKAEAARRKAKERAEKQKLCTRCLKLFVEQAVARANLSDEQKSAFEQFLSKLDEWNDGLQNAQTAADLIPQLSQLSDLLGKLNAAKDIIDRVNTAINQIKQLATGGNGPEQLGTAMQLAAGALDAAAQAIPLLGPLASYFKVLADAVSASISAAYALRDMEGMKFGLGRIDEWAAHCQLVNYYDTANGDLDKVYDRIFTEKEKEGIMRETPEMKARLKQALLAKIEECCLKMLKVQCPVLK